MKYFFDTYAFYEIIVGNPSYVEFTKDVKIVTTQLNLMELYYQLLSLYDKQTALGFFNRYWEFAVPVNNDIVIEAMDFRYVISNRKKQILVLSNFGYGM